MCIAFFLPETLQGIPSVIDYCMIKSRLFWIVCAILIFGVLIVLRLNEPDIKILPSYQTSSMENLYLKHRIGNKVKWELSAGQAILPLGNKEVFLKSLALKINHSPEIYLTSGSGIYKIKEGDIMLNNSVKLNIKDAVFTTNTLKWNSKDELITTEDEVKLTGDKFLIEGTGLSAKMEEQQVRIMKDVKAFFYR